MFDKSVYVNRRKRLAEQMSGGLVLILGNNEAPANYPANTYKFRQDSSFLYLFGLNHPGFAGVLDVDAGEEYIYGNDVDMDDIIWTGPQPSVKDLAARVGVDRTAPFARLAEALRTAVSAGREVHFLPPYRSYNALLLEDMLDIPHASLKARASLSLIRALVALRSVKEPCEIEEITRGCNIGYEMHVTAMKHARPGEREQYIAGLLEGIAASRGSMVSFPVILSQNGETLHNHDHGQVLTPGRLMLTDAGAETLMHYCSDFTRTVPVGGKFSSRQKDIYTIVLACNTKAMELARPGVTYQWVHLEVCKVLARGLKELGVMKGDVEEAVAAGAHALFMPHGLGHMMGLDVHDMEDLGQVHVGYDEETRPIAQFGTSSLRMGRRLEPGFVVTDEPGCYFIPELIDRWRAAKMHEAFLAYDRIDSFKDFGGIRLEDDLLITRDGALCLGDRRVPITVNEVEETMREG
ncbi:MAG: aminopeptidase P family protein [Odoribacteraceae bacterium]|jgi:Xaa-Pro aminopeptidase|nr:aminopeptidase P family protein [Odoribacteraceae bacterium]